MVAKVITTFLALILALSNFIFNCTIGNICAPSHASIFMNYFVRKYIYPLVEGKSLTYFRYIDNIFLIWTETKNR